jgi:deoxyribonuclease-4
MPLLGAHLSVAGGLYKAVKSAVDLGMDTVQIFTHSPQSWSVTGGTSGWTAKTIADSDLRDFRSALDDSTLHRPVAHDSYLINLASADDDLWEKSIAAFQGELLRAEALGLLGVVMHPGAAVASDETVALDRIVTALDRVHAATHGVQVLTLLETTAGQGSTLGHRFEHLAHILTRLADPARAAVCVDTCHIFAAGYSLASAADYRATFAEFDRIVGLHHIRAFHLNDSVKPLGSRVDRHAAIGKGCLGLEPFRLLMNDKRFAKHPMYLETPKGEENGEDLDRINLRTLRDLVGRTDPIEPAFTLEPTPAKKAAKKATKATAKKSPRSKSS